MTAVPPPAGCCAGRYGPALLPVGPDGCGATWSLPRRIDEPVGDDALARAHLRMHRAAPAGALSGTALRFSADATHSVLGGAGRWLLALPSSYIAGLQVLVRSLLADSPRSSSTSRRGSPPPPSPTPCADWTSPSPSDPTTPRSCRPSCSGCSTTVKRSTALWSARRRPARRSGRVTGAAGAREDAGVTVVTTYGMTETCGGCVYDGVPMPGIEVDRGRRRRRADRRADAVHRLPRRGRLRPVGRRCSTTSDLGHSATTAGCCTCSVASTTSSSAAGSTCRPGGRACAGVGRRRRRGRRGRGPRRGLGPARSSRWSPEPDVADRSRRCAELCGSSLPDAWLPRQVVRSTRCRTCPRASRTGLRCVRLAADPHHDRAAVPDERRADGDCGPVVGRRPATHAAGRASPPSPWARAVAAYQEAADGVLAVLALVVALALQVGRQLRQRLQRRRAGHRRRPGRPDAADGVRCGVAGRGEAGGVRVASLLAALAGLVIVVLTGQWWLLAGRRRLHGGRLVLHRRVARPTATGASASSASSCSSGSWRPSGPPTCRPSSATWLAAGRGVRRSGCWRARCWW